MPAVYLPSQDPDPAREERKAKRVLFRPLESFLCGGVPEPDAILRSLKERDNPPQLCGRVFKNGEPTYACRDCGMDPTCVLCIECFQHSAHRNHRYKVRVLNTQLLFSAPRVGSITRVKQQLGCGPVTNDASIEEPKRDINSIILIALNLSHFCV